MHKITIIEDDAEIARGMATVLQKWGYEAKCVQDFARVLDEISAYQPHLVLMDISLPQFNGYYWCKKLRETSHIPVIFVSSRSDSMDVVMAVNMGGDDYIQKPFAPEVLVAKVQAMLRRTYNFEKEQTVLIGTAQYDEKAGLLEAGQERFLLTRNENRILSVLTAKRGRIVSREDIMLALWDSDEFVDDNTLTVNINRLRKTLEKAGVKDAITTHKGQGYRLNA